MAEHCTNCSAELKLGVLTVNQRLPKAQVDLINLAYPDRLESACNKCGSELFVEARTALGHDLARRRSEVAAFLPELPIVSINDHSEWKFRVIGLVTAQTVTGTGMLSDVASVFTDMFGAQSNTYIAKLREGENLCKDQLRARTLEAGGNAIIGADIDYAEVGGQRAMLMVCMTGTAIEIESGREIAEDFPQRASECRASVAQIKKMQSVLDTVSY